MIFTDYNLQEGTDENSLRAAFQCKWRISLHCLCTALIKSDFMSGTIMAAWDWIGWQNGWSSVLWFWYGSTKGVGSTRECSEASSYFQLKHSAASAPIQSTGLFQTEICAIYAMLMMFHLLQTSATLTACWWFALSTEYAKAGYTVHSARNFIQGMF